MRSDKERMMAIGWGIFIAGEKGRKSRAVADGNYFVWPKNVEGLKVEGDMLCFAGGNDWNFSVEIIEVWGLN